MVVSQPYPMSLSASLDSSWPMKCEPHFWVTTALEPKVDAWKSRFGGKLAKPRISCLSRVWTRLTDNSLAAILKHSE